MIAWSNNHSPIIGCAIPPGVFISCLSATTTIVFGIVAGKEGTGRRALGQLLSPDVSCFTLEVSFYASRRDNVGLVPYTMDGYVELGRCASRSMVGAGRDESISWPTANFDKREHSRSKHFVDLEYYCMVSIAIGQHTKWSLLSAMRRPLSKGHTVYARFRRRTRSRWQNGNSSLVFRCLFQPHQAAVVTTWCLWCPAKALWTPTSDNV